MTSELPTFFASPERADAEDVAASTRAVQEELFKSVHLKQVLNALPTMILILNKHRQIVFASDEVFARFDPKRHILLGLRPGEALGCVVADDAKSGCGTAEACESCGAVLAILAAQSNQTARDECCIVNAKGEQASLAVSSAPIDVRGEQYVLFSFADISDTKRRRQLERTFFHDILNTASALEGAASYALSDDADAKEVKELFRMIYPTSVRLMDEIQAQQDLLAAENEELAVERAEVGSTELLSEIIEIFGSHPLAENRKLALADDAESFTILTDRRILGRVIVNMLKNALEATKPGETVTLGAKREPDGQARFFVHNPGIIPEALQSQIFKRSISTKGKNRGLGTLSIKLFTEKYLKGSVGFTSTSAEGTTFFGIFPEK